MPVLAWQDMVLHVRAESAETGRLALAAAFPLTLAMAKGSKNMSAIDKLGVVWGCAVALFLLLISGPAQITLGAGVVQLWALLVITPWALLRGLTWAFKGAR